MSEKVTAWRGPVEADPYGNPVQGDPIPWGEFVANVAPNHPSEPVEVGRSAVITGYTVYVEGAEPTGILPTDLIEIRSPLPDTASVSERRAHLLPVDGLVASWYRKSDGAYRGDQFAVKGVSG